MLKPKQTPLVEKAHISKETGSPSSLTLNSWWALVTDLWQQPCVASSPNSQQTSAWGQDRRACMSCPISMQAHARI